MDEGKRILISFLRITGVLLIGFPIYVYIVNSKGLSAIWPFVASTIVLGVILVVISTIIWKRERKNNPNTSEK